MDELLKSVPKALHDRFREIVALTDAYCAAHLNAEYRDLCRVCAADACRAGVPVASGKPAGWAAGVVSAVAYANFLGSDPSQPFHTPPDVMAQRAGVSPATLSAKSKAVRDALGIDRCDSRFAVRALAEKNPMSAMLAQLAEVFTNAPPPPPAPRRRKPKRAAPAGPPRVYELEVFILQGPMTAKFLKQNRAVSRTIEIRGDQTLEDLHWAIYDAFDREDPHMYEFQFGKGPMDPKGPRYVMPEAGDYGDDGPPVAGYTDETTIDELPLKKGARFGYWFDFGDDWHHQLNVLSITEGAPKGTFPRVTKRVGESPPQYID